MSALTERAIHVAIVDYGLGNIFSIQHACRHAGMEATITALPGELLAADVVILPGVGAFGDAMTQLRQRDLVQVLHDVAAAGTLLVGICLGMQLFMTESEEFGAHKGLGLIEGPVLRFTTPRIGDRMLKVPQVGWNQIHAPADGMAQRDWSASPLCDVPDGTFMYFVHSYYTKPTASTIVLATTRYGDIEFCSSLQLGNIFASQFHPERSGPDGLHIYRTLASLAAAKRRSKANG